MHKPLIATSLTLALLCMISTFTQAQSAAKPAASPALIAAGQQVFTKNCFACHSVMEGQQKVGPSLYHVNSGPHPRVTVTQIRGYLENGNSGSIGVMPSFKGILTKEDTDALLAYLHTL